jgi:hypothetical protein
MRVEETANLFVNNILLNGIHVAMALFDVAELARFSIIAMALPEVFTISLLWRLGFGDCVGPREIPRLFRPEVFYRRRRAGGISPPVFTTASSFRGNIWKPVVCVLLSDIPFRVFICLVKPTGLGVFRILPNTLFLLNLFFKRPSIVVDVLKPSRCISAVNTGAIRASFQRL